MHNRAGTLAIAVVKYIGISIGTCTIGQVH